MYVIARVRLAKDTKAITTKTGTRMQTGFGFADIDGDSGLPVGLVAFSNLADVLAKYHKGDTLRVSGKLKENNYTNRDGEEVNGYQIICEGIAGVKAATMKHQERKPKADPETQQQRNQATDQFNQPPDFDDDLSF